METLVALIGIILLALALYLKPIRKTIGLLFAILGTLLCFTFVGAVIGIPMIVVGGLLLFI